MTAAETTDDPWERFFRWGPLFLLAAGTVLSAGSASLIMTPTERYAAVPPAAIALGYELWRVRRRPEGPDAAYYAGRTILAFVLSWLNPFFAVYAVMGYFDAGRSLPQRWVRPGLLVTAVILAGSQSGGLPPQNLAMWLAFGLLVVLNATIATVMLRLGEREDIRTRERIEMIDELERANRRLEQALSENETLHARLLVHAREAGIDDERRRLAAEIHDTLAQGLAGIVTQLQAAQDTADPPAARRHVERAASLARRSLGDARRSVHDLAPEALEHDALDGALAHFVSVWSREAGVAAGFTVTGTPVPLRDDIGATLLRIVQEALTNVDKHAGAQRVGVTLSYMDDEVSLDVRDDGCGFAPDGTGGGFGLRGMRSRAARWGGSVAVESVPGDGTAISVRIPLMRPPSTSEVVS